MDPATQDLVPDHEAPPQTAISEEQAGPVYRLLAHGEQSEYITSTRSQTNFTVHANVYAIPQEPHPFALLPLDPPQQQLLHYELTFLSRHALHVRFSLATQNQQPFLDDPAFPPTRVRHWLSTGYFPKPGENEDDLRQQEKDVRNCGVELRAGDFNTWVNPHLKGGMEYQFVKDNDGVMGFEGFYHYAEEMNGDQNANEPRLSQDEADTQRKGRIPLWKQSTNGPFSFARMPSGVSSLENEVKCFELFEFVPGENLHIAFTKKDDEPEMLFFYTDRGWGCLVKKPEPIKIDWLQRLRGPQILLSLATIDDRMEYIIVAGDALKKMKAEYGNEKEKDA